MRARERSTCPTASRSRAERVRALRSSRPPARRRRARTPPPPAASARQARAAAARRRASARRIAADRTALRGTRPAHARSRARLVGPRAASPGSCGRAAAAREQPVNQHFHVRSSASGVRLAELASTPPARSSMRRDPQRRVVPEREHAARVCRACRSGRRSRRARRAHEPAERADPEPLERATSGAVSRPVGENAHRLGGEIPRGLRSPTQRRRVGSSSGRRPARRTASARRRSVRGRPSARAGREQQPVLAACEFQQPVGVEVGKAGPGGFELRPIPSKRTSGPLPRGCATATGSPGRAPASGQRASASPNAIPQHALSLGALPETSPTGRAAPGGRDRERPPGRAPPRRRQRRRARSGVDRHGDDHRSEIPLGWNSAPAKPLHARGSPPPEPAADREVKVLGISGPRLSCEHPISWYRKLHRDLWPSLPRGSEPQLAQRSRAASASSEGDVTRMRKSSDTNSMFACASAPVKSGCSARAPLSLNPRDAAVSHTNLSEPEELTEQIGRERRPDSGDDLYGPWHVRPTDPVPAIVVQDEQPEPGRFVGRWSRRARPRSRRRSHGVTPRWRDGAEGSHRRQARGGAPRADPRRRLRPVAEPEDNKAKTRPTRPPMRLHRSTAVVSSVRWPEGDRPLRRGWPGREPHDDHLRSSPNRGLAPAHHRTPVILADPN